MLMPHRAGSLRTLPKRWLVGATGFEPATFRPPAGCATRLRHAPLSARVYGRSVRHVWEHVFVTGAGGGFRCSRCREIKAVTEFTMRGSSGGRPDVGAKRFGEPDLGEPFSSDLSETMKERVTGVEPVPRAWKALVQPLHHTRLSGRV
jgi:hypothetical protein